MSSNIYDFQTVEWYSQQQDATLTARIGRVFTRSNTSKLFRVISADIHHDASVRVTNGEAVCQSKHCDNPHTCDHVRAVRALLI